MRNPPKINGNEAFSSANMSLRVFGNYTDTKPELRVGGVNGGVLIYVYTRQSPELKHSSVLMASLSTNLFSPWIRLIRLIRLASGTLMTQKERNHPVFGSELDY